MKILLIIVAFVFVLTGVVYSWLAKYNYDSYMFRHEPFNDVYIKCAVLFVAGGFVLVVIAKRIKT